MKITHNKKPIEITFWFLGESLMEKVPNPTSKLLVANRLMNSNDNLHKVLKR